MMKYALGFSAPFLSATAMSAPMVDFNCDGYADFAIGSVRHPHGTPQQRSRHILVYMGGEGGFGEHPARVVDLPPDANNRDFTLSDHRSAVYSRSCEAVPTPERPDPSPTADPVLAFPPGWMSPTYHNEMGGTQPVDDLQSMAVPWHLARLDGVRVPAPARSGEETRADVTGDGYPDFITVVHTAWARRICGNLHGCPTRAYPQLWVYPGGPMGWSDTPIMSSPGKRGWNTARSPGDIDGDGRDDIVVYQASSLHADNVYWISGAELGHDAMFRPLRVPESEAKTGMRFTPHDMARW
jgi:hypothetical protein